MATFTYDLGQNWKLEQTVTEEKGKGVVEEMVFYKADRTQVIILPNESCEKLRTIFKKINK